MTSFLYLVSYRAHCGAIVAVFISGPKHAQDRGTRGQAWLDVGYGEPATLEHPEALTGLRLTIHPLV